jgi:hypothetical protein
MYEMSGWWWWVPREPACGGNIGPSIDLFFIVILPCSTSIAFSWELEEEK